MCNDRRCKRKNKDPNWLSEINYYLYVEDVGPCNEFCQQENCGVILEEVLCGNINALQNKCHKDSGFDELSSDED